MQTKPFAATLSVRKTDKVVAFLLLLPFALAIAANRAFLALTPLLLVLRQVVPPGKVLVLAHVHADASGLRVGPKYIPRGRIREVHVHTFDLLQYCVRVRYRGGSPIDLVVAGPEEGRAILRALRFDATQSVASFRVSLEVKTSWRMRTAFVGALILVGFLGTLAAEPPGELPEKVAGAFGTITLFMILTAVTMVAYALSSPWGAEVGADGVLFRQLWRRRFVPTSNIQSASVVQRPRGWRSVMLYLRDGAPMSIIVGRGDEWAFAERVSEIVRDVGTPADDTAVLLRRGDRSLTEWIGALRSLGARTNATFRTAPLDPERLWGVVESAAASGVDRAAAAIALASSHEDADRERLRFVVGAVAEPKLRVAIAAAAHGDDATIEEALRHVSEEDEAPPNDARST